jgi:RNA polymerase sigma-70 factor, ECF subfamily
MLKESAPWDKEVWWVKLCEQYPRVLGFFRNHHFPDKGADDLAQDTYVRAIQRFNDLEALGTLDNWILTIDDLGHWILKTAENVWRNELRYRGASKREAPIVSLEELDPNGDAMALKVLKAFEDFDVPSPLDKLLTDRCLAAVKRCIATLEPTTRQCMWLRHFQERTYKEMAIILQIPEGSVKSQLHKGRRVVRECYEQWLARGEP